MARRWISSAILSGLVVGLVGSGVGLGVASAAPAQPRTAAVVHAAKAGSQLPVKVPAKLHGVGGTLIGTVPTFTHNNGKAVAHMVFTKFKSNAGTVTRLPHAVRATAPVTKAAHASTAAAASSCRILNLVLGPLHLNLLGLVVNLNRVHLQITAVGGPGNLLGNLLCAVANLLNGSAPAANKASLLNDVLGTLGILGRL